MHSFLSFSNMRNEARRIQAFVCLFLVLMLLLEGKRFNLTVTCSYANRFLKAQICACARACVYTHFPLSLRNCGLRSSSDRSLSASWATCRASACFCSHCLHTCAHACIRAHTHTHAHCSIFQILYTWTVTPQSSKSHMSEEMITHALKSSFH